MQPETRLCQNCHKEFKVETDDINFYEKIKVPAPTWCPACRLLRRFMFQNTWNLNWNNCDKCGEKVMSIFPPDHTIPIFCQPCWWADTWDGTEYGMDYDPSRPFLEQVKELSEKTPYATLCTEYLTNKNSGYSNALAWSKDCYMVFWADYCESVFYSSILFRLKFSADCLRANESELCYESIGINKCYQTYFSQECDACVDVWFSRNCYNCTNCVGCVNLRGESYCIFNVKYSKEDYAEKLKELNFVSAYALEEFKNKSEEFWLTKPHRVYAGNSMNLNVTGDYVYESKNSKEMYICIGAENCKWAQFITMKTAKDCFDYSGWGNNSELIYESVTVGEGSNSVCFGFECWPNSLNLQYCILSTACKNSFGCVNLKRKSYCILNKEYSKEEFEKLRAQIIEDMKTNPYIDKLGRTFTYGEFFSPEMSKFPYNKSNAMRFFPKTKEEALAEGYEWSDVESPTHPISIQSENLPETIAETTDAVLNETVGCAVCSRAYKITAGELGLLRKMNLPVPHECPKCRENRRFSKINMPGLYDRTCMKCNAEIRTPFAPGRPEIVYCEKCYQQEFA